MLVGKSFSKLKRYSTRGFTLVELLIVIAIIGILVTIVVIAIDPARVIQNSNDTKRRSELSQIKVSMQLYFNENDRYPTTGEMGTGGTVPFVPTYMKQLPSWWATEGDYGTNSTDYDAGVDLQLPNTEDGNSKTKCDGNTLITFADSDYIVCPD